MRSGHTFTEAVEGGLGTDGLLFAGAAGLPYLLQTHKHNEVVKFVALNSNYGQSE